MADDYEYDIFLSYSRAGNVGDWVRNHFHPRLRDAMTDLLPAAPSIFLDVAQEVGVQWPANLTYALLRSRYLVAVWSRPYFESRWCMAEWRTMQLRETMLGMASDENPRTLVYPVVFADGETFPPEAQAIHTVDFRAWNYPMLSFADTIDYIPFWAAVNKCAGELVERLPHAPPWQREWPIARPEPEPRKAMGLPRL